MPFFDGKFSAPYVLIIEEKVGVFNVWSIDQYADALAEFSGKRAVVFAVTSGDIERALAQQMGIVWDIIADAFEVVGVEIFENLLFVSGRLGFCYSTSYEDFKQYYNAPDWCDLLHVQASQN